MNHSHHHGSEEDAQRKAANQEEKLAEKTMHGHEEAASSDTHAHPPHGEHSGHGNDHHRMMIADFKRRFWVSVILAVPVVLLSPMVQHILGFQLEVPFQQYIAFALSSVIFFYGGWPFLTGLGEELKKAAPGMM
ncbi:MAG: heavy metal translocating P-type ATPase, partial [Hymenobacteraceae bacterium]|nr:heavy metal translocating P-type ATPase [Hymenobacteraceae bacterium]MDX5394665.1 heavy metal translocating P-type ATPase [Hymenobacteraceae bacterium]MDX5510696.1 heavy metal translocating P-type ATPase [Hymenobacteraceae bacterium]